MNIIRTTIHSYALYNSNLGSSFFYLYVSAQPNNAIMPSGVWSVSFEALNRYISYLNININYLDEDPSQTLHSSLSKSSLCAMEIKIEIIQYLFRN